MTDKITTIEHLRKQAVKSKFYSAAGLAELSSLMAAGLESVTHTGIAVILPAAGWRDNSQKVMYKSFLADDNCWYLVCPDTDCFMEYSDAGVKADNVTVDGEMTFRCDVAPETDLTVNILKMEVEV